MLGGIAVVIFAICVLGYSNRLKPESADQPVSSKPAPLIDER